MSKLLDEMVEIYGELRDGNTIANEQLLGRMQQVFMQTKKLEERNSILEAGVARTLKQIEEIMRMMGGKIET